MKIFFIIFIFISFTLFGQQSSQDSIQLIRHSPKKAAIWSFVMPGAGQIYNQLYSTKNRYGAYWKVPIIYASLIATGNLFLNAVRTESEIRTEYYNREKKVEQISSKWSNYTSNDLILLHESAVKKRTMFGLLVGGVYAIQIIEASIDAHFLHFDISPSITMRVKPTYIQHTAGLQLTLDFN